MKVLVLIMAGGEGKRMGLAVEKPLLTFLGRPLLEWVVKATESAQRKSLFYVITSKNTPKTEEKCLSEGMKVLRTDGKGYHNDLKQAITEAGIGGPVLTISSDLPAMTGEFLDKIVSMYEKSEKDALTVLVPVEKRRELGLSVSSTYPFGGSSYFVSGVNLVDGTSILKENLSECAFITEDIEAVLNVNTLKDLEIAEKILLKSRKK